MEHTLFIVFVCSCVFSLFTTTSAIVGTDCNSNAAVCADDPNSECAAGSPKRCACKDNYEAKPNAICLKATLGADCSADGTVCTTGDVHSVCNSSKKCACKSGYTANRNGVCAKVPGNSATKTVMNASTLVMLISTMMLAKYLF